MTALRVMVYGEGSHELGRDHDRLQCGEGLSALPRLIHRLAGEPENVSYKAHLLRNVPPVHGKGPKLAKKVARAINEAGRRGYAAVVILIDRDGKPDSERIRPLREGRDTLAEEGCPPCAVGTAVEAFDAWLICDANAVKRAGGDPEKTHPAPENLVGRKGSGSHPKDVADKVFGARGGTGLGANYAVVSKHINLEVLENMCPKGFAPFATEVKQRIAPALAGT